MGNPAWNETQMDPGYPGISYITTYQAYSRKGPGACPPLTFTVIVGDDGTVGVSSP